MKTGKFYLFVVCLSCFSFCFGQKDHRFNDVFFTETDTMVTLSSCIASGLIRWNRNHECWTTKADTILHTQQILDSVITFIRRDINSSYVITKHVSAQWKTLKPYSENRSSRLLKDYLVWRGVDSMSLWLALDTVPNCPPLISNENCRHYFEIIKVKPRLFSGWIKEGVDKILPNAYLYGIVIDNYFGGQQEIGRSDSTGRFVCYVPNVPMTIVIKDKSGAELKKFNIGTEQQIDNMIINLEKR